jgi:hypothetical protein
MATRRNLAIAIFKLAGTTNFAAACRSQPGMPPAC